MIATETDFEQKDGTKRSIARLARQSDMTGVFSAEMAAL